MEITKFAQKVAKLEGKKVGVSIAQIAEILKVINDLTKGLLYAIVRWMK